MDTDPDINIELSRGTRHTPCHSRDIDMTATTPSLLTTTCSTHEPPPTRPIGSRSRSDSSQSPPPPTLSPSSVPTHRFPPEVSIVEASDVTGVSFKPEYNLPPQLHESLNAKQSAFSLWMQRRAWAMQVLRREGVRSVLDIGCGEGALLETLIVPPCSIHEPPIVPLPGGPGNSASECTETSPEPELFINRLAGLDISPSIVPRATEVLQPDPTLPRWETLTAELWVGAIEKYNSRLEGFDAIVALELIEHLEPDVLSRFGVVTMGTYRPRVMLVSTPNFDFNAKFPRAEEYEQRGYVDPTGRTARVFRHSDHKVEMTGEEFKDWALAAAADWGYEVELGGVGVSSVPSYYSSGAPIYATQTAIFRRSSEVPPRSPRSVRTISLPFMREAEHPHRQALRVTHPANKQRVTRVEPEKVRSVVRSWFKARSTTSASSTLGLDPGVESSSPSASTSTSTSTNTNASSSSTTRGGVTVTGEVEKDNSGHSRVLSEVSIDEIWPEVGEYCAGSRRALFACLGGWGDVQAVVEPQMAVERLSVRNMVKAVKADTSGFDSEKKHDVGSGRGSVSGSGSGSGSGDESLGEMGQEFRIIWKRDGWVVKWRNAGTEIRDGRAESKQGVKLGQEKTQREMNGKEVQVDNKVQSSEDTGGW